VVLLLGLLRFGGAALLGSKRCLASDFHIWIFVISYPASSICIHMGSHSAFSMELLYSLTILSAPLILNLSQAPLTGPAASP